MAASIKVSTHSVVTYDLIPFGAWTVEEVLDILRHSRGWVSPEIVAGESTGREFVFTCLKEGTEKKDDHVDGVSTAIAVIFNVKRNDTTKYEQV
jgi:hypothetical protein